MARVGVAARYSTSIVTYRTHLNPEDGGQGGARTQEPGGGGQGGSCPSNLK